MKRALSCTLTLLAATLAVAPARANDTMADLKAGGLVFVTTDNVEMASEDLYLSPHAVKVDYVFHNSGDKDQTSVVAFPMPDVEGSGDFMVSVPDDGADNFMDFSVTIEGQPVTPEIDRHAFAAEVDVTALLTAHAIPLLPFGEATTAALGKLPPDVLDDWTRRGMVFRDEYDAGQGLVVDWTPLWRLKTTYWWRTTFPAGKDLRVSHRYKPSVGATAGLAFASYADDGKPRFSGPDFDREQTKYCMDGAFVKAVEKRVAANAKQGDRVLMENWLSYVLTTGANWGGTIGKFHLTIDKGKPETLVSFCGDGVKKTGPTTFEINATDYYPERDIDVMLLNEDEL